MEHEVLSFHVPLAPTPTAFPTISTPHQWTCYNQGTYTDTSLSPKPTVYIVVHSMDLDKYIMTSVYHCHHIQTSFTALKIFCTPPLHPSLSLTTALLIVSIVLSFLEYRHFSFFHVFSWLHSALIFSTENSIVWRHHNLFTCWRTPWLLSSFGKYILDNSFLSDISFASIFFQSVVCLLTILTLSLTNKNF